MFSIGEPSERRMIEFLRLQRDSPFSYEDVGASRVGEVPAGYAVDHNRARLGEGEVRTLTTLVLTMSMVFVVVGGLATILVYSLTDSLETGLAVGLLAGLLGWLGVSLIPEFLVAVQDHSRKRG